MERIGIGACSRENSQTGFRNHPPTPPDSRHTGPRLPRPLQEAIPALAAAALIGSLFGGALPARGQTPPDQTPQDQPPAETGVTGGSSIPTQPLTVDEIVRIALERNLNLIQAQQRVDVARGAYTSSYSGLLPNARAAYSFQRSASNINRSRTAFVGDTLLLVPPGTQYGSSYNLALNGGWNLIDLPSWYSHSSARHNLLAERYAYTRTRSQMALTVKQEYFALIRARELAKVAEEALTLSEDQLKRSQSLFQLGSVARSDVLQAQVNQAASERERISATNAVDQERARLNLLLAYPIGTSLDVQDPEAVPDSVTTPPEDELIRTAEANRADYLQAQSDLEAARASELSSKSARYPSLVGGYEYNKSGDKAGDPIKKVGKDANWGFNLGLSLDIFDGLRTKGAIQQGTANRRAAERALDAVRLQVALDVREALIGIKNATEEIRSARQGVSFAEESVRLQKALYENGGGTLLEWNNAQVELTRARQALIAAEIDLRAAQAALENATGQDVR